MRVLLLTGVAIAALTSTAFAQQATGLYVSAGVGANFIGSDDVDVDFTDVGGPDVNGSASYDVGPVGVVAVGYDWGYLRTEAELGIRSNDFDDLSYPFQVFSAEGHERTITAMANVLVDFDLGAVTLYGGGGLGIANVEFHAQNDFYDVTGFDTVLAWQGIAGLAFNVTPQLAITGEYRYLSSFEDPSFDDTGFAFFQCGSCGELSAPLSNHSALIGVRYTFAPPAAAVVDTVAEKSYLVFFDFDSSQLTPDAQSIVATAAADALAGGSPSLNVTGHTDRSGSDAYNQALSIRRATAVQNALIAGGVPAGIIVIRGAGESEPLVPTADGVREPQNRRVEIVIN
jgi:OOP family OmpA-OmpF porin